MAGKERNPHAMAQGFKDARLGDVGSCDIQQCHLVAVQQFFDVDQNQHTLTQRAKTCQVLGGQGNREFRCRSD